MISNKTYHFFENWYSILFNISCRLY